jgi:hypothetical protein
MARAELSRRVEKVVGYPPLSELGDLQRRELHRALLGADSSRICPRNWRSLGCCFSREAEVLLCIKETRLESFRGHTSRS